MAEDAAVQGGTENSGTNSKRGPSKKHSAAVILLLLIMAGASVGTSWWIKSKRDISTDDAFIDAHVYPVSARVQGHVSSVLVDDNQFVRKGDPLIELDPADYDVAMKDNETSVVLAQNEVKSDYAKLESAKAAVSLAKSRLELARKEAGRGGDLYDRGIIAKQDLDRLVTEKKVSESQLRDAQESVRKAEADIGLLVKGGKEAKVAQQRAKLEQARLNLSYTRVLAPSDGYITRKSIEPGSNIQPGQPLMALVRLDDAWITANYKESQLTYVRTGLKVEFEVDAYPSRRFRGTVESIMAGTGAAFSLLPPENATGNFVKIVQRVPVKILIDRSSDPQHLLRVGMSVVPTIYTGRGSREILRDALSF